MALTLPWWFPEIDAVLRLPPIIAIEFGALRREYNVRWYTITRCTVSLCCWRGMWRWQAGMNIYRRLER